MKVKAGDEFAEKNIPRKKVDTNTYMRAVKEMLREGQEIPLVITGNSMSPFLIHERDKILIRRADRPLKRGDMAFYQRITGQYVMHRIRFVKQEKPGERERYYFIGDAQNITEGPIYKEQIFGEITAVCRKGRWIRPGDFWWEFFRTVWLRIIFLRRGLVAAYSILRRITPRKIGREKR